MGCNNEDDLQMSFGFYDDVESNEAVRPVKRNVSELLEKIDFETEEDALAALIGQTPVAPEGEESDPWSGQVSDVLAESRTENDSRELSAEQHENTESFALPEEKFSGQRQGDMSPAVPSEDGQTEVQAAGNTMDSDHAGIPPWDEPELQDSPAEDVPEKDFAEETATEDPVKVFPVQEMEKKRKSSTPVMNIQLLRRVALGFLARLKPSAAAMRVPTLLGGRYKADAAAFWLPAGCRTELQPERTALVLCVLDHDDFVREPENRKNVLDEWNQAVDKKEKLEAVIRQKEPYTKIVSLFAEEEKWDYSLSKNRTYHACLRKISKLFKQLATDSIYSRMIFEDLADEYYLLSPAGVIQQDEVPEGWGLVWAEKDLSTEIVCPAEPHQCPAGNRINLALRIAGAGLEEQLFANGIDVCNDNPPVYRPLPKRRKSYTFE